MFTVNILFQIITPVYLTPALDKLEEADGTRRATCSSLLYTILSKTFDTVHSKDTGL